MGIRVGISTANPATSSDTTLFNSIVGWKIDFYDTEETSGIATVQLGSSSTGFSRSYMQNSGLIEKAGTVYEDKILPTKTNYVNLRLERGEPVNSNEVNWSADWILKVYEEDNWTGLYDTEPTANGNHFFNRQLANLGGYLVMAVDTGHPSGNLQLDIGDVRAYAGDQIPPW